LDLQLSEELEGSVLLREKLQAIHKGLARVTRNHERASSVLDQCEASEKLGSDVVEQAVINCQVSNRLLLLVQSPLHFENVRMLNVIVKVANEPGRISCDRAYMYDPIYVSKLIYVVLYQDTHINFIGTV
jgi:nesprin-1